MKLIGTSESGNPIVELEESDRRLLFDVGAWASSVPMFKMEVPARLPVAEGVKKMAALIRKAKTQKPSTISERKCRKCGKQFTPWRRDQGVCSACSHPTRKKVEKSPAPPVHRTKEFDPEAEIREAARRAREEI